MGQGPNPSIASMWVGCVGCRGSCEIPSRAPQVTKFSAHALSSSSFLLGRNGYICLIGMISFCLAALIQVNTALKTSFPDILARQSSQYGTVKPHFNFVSKHVSSLFINLKVLPFLIELPSLCYLSLTHFFPFSFSFNQTQIRCPWLVNAQVMKRFPHVTGESPTSFLDPHLHWLNQPCSTQMGGWDTGYGDWFVPGPQS